MMHTSHTGRTLLAALALFTAAAHAGSVTVRSEAYVQGPRVTLGDVADFEGIEGPTAETLASVELIGAAAPGASTRINAALIESRIRNAGFDPGSVTVGGARSVEAVTLHLEVTPDMLESSLREFIAANMPWNAEDAVIDVAPHGRLEIVPDGHLEFRWFPAPQYRYVGAGAFRGEIVVNGVPRKSVSVRANIEPYTEVLVAVDSIPRGRLIGPADVVSERRPVASLRQRAVGSVDELQDLVAQTGIQPGQVITERHVAPRMAVRRNDIVTVEVRVGGLAVTTRAKALADGRVGETLLCENIESRGRFTGVVREDGVVVAQ